MPKESFDRAAPNIISFFEKHPFKAYTTHDIQQIFDLERYKWKIANYRNYKHFITFLNERKILLLDIQNHEAQNSVKQILRKKDATPFHVGLTTKKGGYLSNYSAMQLHQLTLQLPKTVYVSDEKYEDIYAFKPREVELEQEAVDRAFSKPQRVATESYKSTFDGFRYVYLQRKHTSVNIGITTIKDYAVTDLERTLIDIAVRPAYSGGSFEVLEAYRNAKPKIDVQKLNEYLNQLDYIYPYHQLIGFYLDLAGFSKESLQIFLDRKTNINFYQTYNLSNKKLNEKWGIYYPTGLEAL